MSDLILYTSEDGKSRIQLRAKDQTVWLSQREMAELFDVSTDNVGLHLKNIFAEGELDENSVAEESSVTTDYDKTDKATQQFFAVVQNIILYAVTAKTAAELIIGRADQKDPNFGLLHWKGAKVRKTDILTAKNYLTEDEIDTLNRLVVIFLETAELRAKSRQETRMSFWKGSVDSIITSNGFRLLNHAGSISYEQMENKTNALYLDYDQSRKKQEALEADQEDEADLKALENILKRRAKPKS